MNKLINVQKWKIHESYWQKIIVQIPPGWWRVLENLVLKPALEVGVGVKFEIRPPKQVWDQISPNFNFFPKTSISKAGRDQIFDNPSPEEVYLHKQIDHWPMVDISDHPGHPDWELFLSILTRWPEPMTGHLKHFRLLEPLRLFKSQPPPRPP